MIGQPDAIGCLVELRAIPMHRRGVYRQHDRIAASPADRSRGLGIAGEVHVGSASRSQALGSDPTHEPFNRPVVEHGGRRSRRQSEVHRDRMPLSRSNPPATELEPELVGPSDQAIDQDPIYRPAVLGERVQHRFDLDPSTRVELETHGGGVMTEHVGQELARRDEFIKVGWSGCPSTRSTEARRCGRHVAQ